MHGHFLDHEVIRSNDVMSREHFSPPTLQLLQPNPIMLLPHNQFNPISFTSAANCKAIHPAISCQTQQLNRLNVESSIPPIFMQAILSSSRRLNQTSMPYHSENSVPFPPYYAAPKPSPSTYVTFRFRHARDSLRYTYTTPQTLITCVTICLFIVHFLRHNFTQKDTHTITVIDFHFTKYM